VKPKPSVPPSPSPADAAEPAPPSTRYVLSLYLTGSTAASARALVNTRRFCERFLAPNYELEIIDISLQPRRLQPGQIVAVPTLVKTLPLPVRRFIGDMSNTERLLRGFELQGSEAAPER
jgi:circadian clock protein KaiB